jgi:hypothetical protein
VSKQSFLEMSIGVLAIAISMIVANSRDFNFNDPGVIGMFGIASGGIGMILDAIRRHQV